MKFSEKVWSDHGMTLLHFWSIPRNHAMPRCITRGRGLLCFSSTAELVIIIILLLQTKNVNISIYTKTDIQHVNTTVKPKDII